MKFLALGVHGPVDSSLALEVGPRAAAWLDEQLAAGVLDCAYSMEGGGRLLIADAPDEDALRAMLRAAPDVEREWTITALTDARESIARYLATLRTS